MRELEGKDRAGDGRVARDRSRCSGRVGRMGAKVFINYTANEAAANEAAAAVVTAGGTSSLKRFDVSDSGAVDAAIKEIVSTDGGLHILVNNAGIAINTLVLGAKDADWKRTLDVNLTGTFNCCRSSLRFLIKAREKGRIINIASDHRRDRLGGAGAVRRGQGGRHRVDQDVGARVRVARRDRATLSRLATSTPT